jgi:hypothetical protein
MHKYALWVRERTTTTGTGDITLAGAITGYTTFSSQINAGDSVLYSIKDGNDRELGVGTLSATNILQRTTIRATLVGGFFTANPTSGLNLSGVAEVSVTDDRVLSEWSEGIRQSTGHDGEILVVGAGGLAGLAGTVDGGVIP